MMQISKKDDKLLITFDSGVKLNLSFTDQSEEEICKTIRIISKSCEKFLVDNHDLVDIMLRNGFSIDKEITVLN